MPGSRPSVPAEEWVWCGFPGHLVVSADCLFHLTTRVGDYRISTVGDYRPRQSDGQRAKKPEPIGAGEDSLFETFVFPADDSDTECGNGLGGVADWAEIDSERYATPPEAERGHMAMCRKYAALPGSAQGEEAG